MKKYLNVIICFVIISLNKNVFSQHSDLSGVIDTKVCQSGIREDNTNYIYCARQSLQKIPMLSINNNNGAAVSNIVYDELVLSDNLIERIDFNSFGSNFKVRKLYLDNNPLRFIHKSSFEHVRNYLEELYLEQKQIKATTIADSDEVYDEGSELRNGYILDENDSNLFEAAVFQKCFNLHLLSLKSYRIPHLKANMFLKMTKLDTLILASNRLRQIDEAAFAGLEHSLTYLNLDSNHLEWVPSKPLERMKKLKRLSLSQNRIKTLHANAFFYLNSLNTLDLSYNYLSRFDENAFSGSVQNSLRSLQLQNNELKWPHYIYILYNLHLLQDLNLDFNKLGQKVL
jgi:Leucine-rich repeat (LRR) protein